MTIDEHTTAILSALRLPHQTEQEGEARMDKFEAAICDFARELTPDQRAGAAEAFLLAHILHASFPCDGNYPLRLGMLTGAMLKPNRNA